jgi:molybdopterin synthase sulfur carrier subunit
MRVRFFASLRKFTGCVEAEIPYEDTAGALARSLCDRYGVNLRQKIFPVESPAAEGEFSPEIIILINGRHVSHLGGVAAPLKSDDRVDIFPIVAGG